MEAFMRETMSVAMEGDGLEIRLEEAGEMTVGFFRLPSGTDLRPLLHGPHAEARIASGTGPCRQSFPSS